MTNKKVKKNKHINDISIVYLIIYYMNNNTYLKQFGITAESINNDNDSIHKLYFKLLNKFDAGLFQSTTIYENFIQFEENMYDLVENLRTLDVNYISQIFDSLSIHDPRLVDICILLWCIPRSNYMSKNRWYEAYKNLVSLWSNKIMLIIENDHVKNFCIETITKTNYVPIHCFEYLWYYLNDGVCLEHVFVNSRSGMFVGFEYDDSESGSSDIIQCKFYINIEYIFMLGIGTSDITNGKNSLQQHYLDIISNIENIDQLNKSDTFDNLVSQINSVISNWDKYMLNSGLTRPTNVLLRQ